MQNTARMQGKIRDNQLYPIMLRIDVIILLEHMTHQCDWFVNYVVPFDKSFIDAYFATIDTQTNNMSHIIMCTEYAGYAECILAWCESKDYKFFNRAVEHRNNCCEIRKHCFDKRITHLHWDVCATYRAICANGHKAFISN
jgi:hypothetical protein